MADSATAGAPVTADNLAVANPDTSSAQAGPNPTKTNVKDAEQQPGSTTNTKENTAPSKEDTAIGGAGTTSESVVSDVSAPLPAQAQTADSTKPVDETSPQKTETSVSDVSDSNKPTKSDLQAQPTEPTQLSQPTANPPDTKVEPVKAAEATEQSHEATKTEVKDTPLDDVALKDKQESEAPQTGGSTEQAEKPETAGKIDSTTAMSAEQPQSGQASTEGMNDQAGTEGSNTAVRDDEAGTMARSEAISDKTKALLQTEKAEPGTEEAQTVPNQPSGQETQAEGSQADKVQFDYTATEIPAPAAEDEKASEDKPEVPADEAQNKTEEAPSDLPAGDKGTSQGRKQFEGHDELLKNFHKVLNSELSKLTGVPATEIATTVGQTKVTTAPTDENKENSNAASSKPLSPFLKNMSRPPLNNTQPSTNANHTNANSNVQTSQDGPVKIKPKELPPWLAGGGQASSTDVAKGTGTASTDAVQMVGSHEDTQEDVAKSQQEYKKQFSDRKKFFKQQLEAEGGLPIKIAPPPASYRQEAPKALADVTQVVLSPVIAPPQLRFPTTSAPPPQAPANTSGAFGGPGPVPPPPMQPKPFVAPPSHFQPTSQPQAPQHQYEAPHTDSGTFPPAPADQSLASQLVPPPSMAQDALSAGISAPTPFPSPAEGTAPSEPSMPMWSPPVESSTFAPAYNSNAQQPAQQPAPVWTPKFDARSLGAQPMQPHFVHEKPKLEQYNGYQQQVLQQQQQQQQYSPMQSNAYQPQQQQFGGESMANGTMKPSPLPDLIDMGSTAGGKKKTFMDSSFYSDRNELYPTFEEQVKLCQDISSSLTSSENRQSLGARMFTRRKQNAKKWVANGQDGHEQWQSDDEGGEEDSSKPAGPPPLKYYLSPRGVDDAQSLMQKDPDVKIFDGISPISVAAVAQGLQSQRGRGADLFHKRAKKSEEWVIDETNVKKVQPAPMIDLTPLNKIKELLNGPQIKYVQSPWEAALTSPIGSCDKAFVDARRGDADAQMQSLRTRTPSPAGTHSPLYSSQLPSGPQTPTPPPPDNFSRLPRGWGASQPQSSTPKPFESQPETPQYPQPPAPSPKPSAAMFKPQTPEPTPLSPTMQYLQSQEPQQYQRPPSQFQFSPTPTPTFSQQMQQQLQTPEFVSSIHRAGPPVLTPTPPSYNSYVPTGSQFDTSRSDIQADAGVPMYQPAPTTVTRRYSTPYDSMPQQFYQQQQQATSYQQQQNYSGYAQQQNYYQGGQGQGQGSKTVSWHPELKKTLHYSPQSTDEFRNYYSQRHAMWERPPEAATVRQNMSRSRSQPPAAYMEQRQSYGPSYGSSQPARKWGNDMSSWPTPVSPSPTSPRAVSRSRTGTWGSNMHDWAPKPSTMPGTTWSQPQQSYQAQNQNQTASRQRTGTWGSNMHDWAPKPFVLPGTAFSQPQQSQQSYQSQKNNSQGTWGSDMNSWRQKSQQTQQSNQKSWAPDTQYSTSTFKPRFPGPQLHKLGGAKQWPPEQPQQQGQSKSSWYGSTPNLAASGASNGYATLPSRSRLGQHQQQQSHLIPQTPSYANYNRQQPQESSQSSYGYGGQRQQNSWNSGQSAGVYAVNL
ncbi:hypothetical protein RvY_17797-3 [Ramazzottius varieornatus]|uniref:Uncharacterized protein n=1 Tax=Ramazzottius varieornatus TaxID=947166 RepID=A0A1D1W429_RAMVA|nr:hypothetical protein RvY_17797-3 [Ramazzottius varieornatus]